ncbi:hypothetical protein AKJ41_00750 [candidate division MSBL1 archaeon SCGC-AAA259O05]|uniref:Uncharacterized protein n=1 Tax=candidate division MSBL1 archaeon SCGC-AAA259O05 TaxID=1698271 RepID=A0A133V5D4_9EURY|nr:hypothetical protein AKJ41_00750 [candidate division MSBL1 archaeon SCGC-AAA259O05]
MSKQGKIVEADQQHLQELSSSRAGWPVIREKPSKTLAASKHPLRPGWGSPSRFSFLLNGSLK